MSVELKPCPFCGGEAKIVEGEESAYIQCLDVKMHRSMFVTGDNDASDEAAEQWNTRAPEPNQARIEALSAALREAVIKVENDRTMWNEEWQVWLLDARAALEASHD